MMLGSNGRPVISLSRRHENAVQMADVKAECLKVQTVYM